MNSSNIPPIPTDTTGQDLVAAVNDRLRRVSLNTAAGTPGPAGRTGLPGPAGPAGTLGSINLNLERLSVVRTLDQALIDILRESVSVRNFGVVGDGVTDDSAAFQEACSTTAVNGQWLRIPAGFNIYVGGASISIPSGLRLIGDGKKRSKITGNGSLVAGSGLLDLNMVTDVDLIGFGIEGAVTTPVGITYASAGDPSDPQWVNGTSIWIKTGCARIRIEDVDINHTGGYAIYWFGNVQEIDIIRPSIRNSRPNVLGVGSDLNYFGWNGGIFGANVGGGGGANSFSGIRIVDAFYQNCTGHCFWTRSSMLPDPPTMNRNVSFTGEAEDCLGDVTQPGDIDTYYERFKARRIGFICTNGATTGFTTPGVLVDWSPTAVRVPKWLDSGGLNIPATVADTTGILLNADRNWIVDGFNGSAGSGDGMGNSRVSFVATSAFYSTDTLINTSLCGPGGSGTNYCSGFVTSNSNNLSAVGQGIAMTDCEVNGCGYLSLGGYAMRYSSITNCTIRQPIVGGQLTPIVLGSIGSGPYQRAYSVKVSGCHVEWPAPGGAAVSEDISYGPFSPGDTNWIDSSNTYTCGALYTKATATSTTTRSVLLTTVTAAAQSMVGSILQSEGTLTSLADHSLKAYRTDGALLWTATLATFSSASLTISGNGAIDNVRNFTGNSLKITGATIPIVVDSAGNVFGRSLSAGTATPFDLITNSSVNVIDSQSTPVGSTHGSGMTLRSSSLGYMTAIENTDNAINANGLLVKVANANPLTRAFTVNVGGSDLVAITGNGYLTAQAFSIAGSGFISNARDLSVHSVSIDGFGVVIDSSGAFTGAIAVAPPLVLGSSSYTGHNPLTTKSHGAFDNTNDYSPVIGLLGPGATSALDVVNRFNAGNYFGWTTYNREAAGVFATVVPAGNVNWESDGIIAMVVNEAVTGTLHRGSPSGFSGFPVGAVAGSFFAMNAVNGGTVWAQNWVVKDFDLEDAVGHSYSGQLAGVEIDCNISHPGTTLIGIGLNVSFQGARTSMLNPAQNVIGFALQPSLSGYFDYGISFFDNAARVAIGLGACATIANTSQSIEFHSVAFTHVFNNNAGGLSVTTDISGVFGSGGVFTFDRDGSFRASRALAIGANTVVDLSHNFFGHSLSIDGYAFNGGVVVDSFGSVSANAVTIHNGFVNTLVIDNQSTANFAQLKIAGVIAYDAQRTMTSQLIQLGGVWIPSHVTQVNRNIVDTNGNVQTCVSFGTTGTTQPLAGGTGFFFWNQTLHGFTNDGSVVWQNNGPNLALTDVGMYINNNQVFDWARNCTVGICQAAGFTSYLTYEPGACNMSNGYYVNSVQVIDSSGRFTGAVFTTFSINTTSSVVCNGVSSGTFLTTSTLIVTSSAAFSTEFFGSVLAFGGIDSRNGIQATGFNACNSSGTLLGIGQTQDFFFSGGFTVSGSPTVFHFLSTIGGVIVTWRI